MNIKLKFFIVTAFGLHCFLTSVTTAVKAEHISTNLVLKPLPIKDAIESRKLNSLLAVADNASRVDGTDQRTLLIAQVCDALTTYEFTDANGDSTLARQGAIASQLALDELRNIRNNEPVTPIELRFRLLGHIHASIAVLNKAADPAPLRLEKAVMWLTAWHALEEKLTPAIAIPSRRYTHVPPPPGVHITDGDSPQSIKDPVTRKQYEQEIAKSDKDADAQVEQMQLRSMKQTYQHLLIDFCVNCFWQPDDGEHQLSDLLEHYNISKVTSATIIQALEQRRREMGE